MEETQQTNAVPTQRPTAFQEFLNNAVEEMVTIAGPDILAAPERQASNFDRMTIYEAKLYFQDTRNNPTTLPRSVVYNPHTTMVESERVMLSALHHRGVALIPTQEELRSMLPPFHFRRLRHEMVRLIELAAFEGEPHTPNGLELRANGEWLRPMPSPAPEEYVEETPAPPKAPEFNKAVFLNNIRASDELRAIVEGLTEKGDILKAVFEYNNTPKKVPKARINKRALEVLNRINAEAEETYVNTLEAFHRQTMEAFKRGDVGTFLSDWSEIKKGKTLDESIFHHPLFKVQTIGNVRRSIFGRVRNLGLRIRVITREDVYFNFNGMRMNFGKFSFSLRLERGDVTFHAGKDNFRYNAGPYLSASNVCMGSNSYSIQKAIREWRISDALTELYTTMTVFNPESNPYRGLDRFFENAQNGALRRRDETLPVVEYVTAKKPEQNESEEVKF